MEHLFDPVLTRSIQQRLVSLQPDSQPQWGSMRVAPMLAHCTDTIAMARGRLPVKPASLLLRLLGRIIKPFVLRDGVPFRRNVPTMPELLASGDISRDFAAERTRLRETIDEYAASGPDGSPVPLHPLFGRLTGQQWGILMYKHLDHHLRQFDA